MVWLFVIAAFIALFVIFRLLRSWFKHEIVYEYEKGLRYRKGKLITVLGPGSYWYAKSFSHIVKIDMRPRLITIAGQEVLSKDGVTLKVSIVGNFAIDDPVKAIHSSENYQVALYTILQVTLREIIGSSEIDQLLENRADFNKRLLELSSPKVGEMGLKLDSAEIKDIMFPGELKQMFTQTIKARKEGLAMLERARGESAALRNLANSARMLDNNPNLLQLRILQAINETKGNTFVVGMPEVKGILPLKTDVNEEDVLK